MLARGARFAPERRARIEAMLAEEGGRRRPRPRAADRRDRRHRHDRIGGQDFHDTWVLNHVAATACGGEGLDDGYFADIDAELRIAVATPSNSANICAFSPPAAN